MRAYYNDSDRYVAAWLRNLIAAGLLPEGDVDERDIHDVQPADVRGYDQVHLFAGIGGWPYALQLADWPPDAPIWTGSCPCQPYSAAGKGGGDDDPRNLWPEFRRLVAECKPPTVVGEQVASADGRAWLSGVRVDLEDMGYAVGAADLCAASVGAPHIRQRLYWVADADRTGREWARSDGGASDARPDGRNDAGRSGEGLEHPTIDGRLERRAEPERGSVSARRDSSGLAHPEQRTPERRGHDLARTAGSVGGEVREQRIRPDPRSGRDADGLDDTPSDGTGGARAPKPCGNGANDRLPRAAGPWSDTVLVLCADGKTRRLEPGLSPLAHGVPARMGKLRAYGNAIVPQLAAEFVRAYLEARP